MITRIEIDGFKSLRAFSLDLEPLTAIVGPNGAGKSNLFDALALLAKVAETNLVTAFKGGRGRIRDQFARTPEGVERSMRFAVELLLLPGSSRHELGQSRVRYEVEIERTIERGGLDGLVITRERLLPLRQGADAWIEHHPHWGPLARYGTAELCVELEGASGPERIVRMEPGDGGPSLSVDIGRDRSLLSLPYALVTALVEATSRELRSFRLLHLEPHRLTKPSDRAAGTTLAEDGSNLPTVLAALGPESRAAIRKDMETLLPGFRGFEVTPFEDELRLEADFMDTKRLPARLLSDGMLRLLALFTLLRSARRGAIVAIEEPENGVYPGRLRALVDSLLSATSPTLGEVTTVPQVLLSTHSTAIIASLRGLPRAIVFADLVRGRDGMRSTRMRHVVSEGESESGAVPSVSSGEMMRLLESSRPWDD
ncbi:AAA family ATPase [Polyangium spumosum]|nr:AAA family ATPase [Polyangium spumosum]